MTRLAEIKAAYLHAHRFEDGIKQGSGAHMTALWALGEVVGRWLEEPDADRQLWIDDAVLGMREARDAYREECAALRERLDARDADYQGVGRAVTVTRLDMASIDVGGPGRGSGAESARINHELCDQVVALHTRVRELEVLPDADRFKADHPEMAKMAEEHLAETERMAEENVALRERWEKLKKRIQTTPHSESEWTSIYTIVRWMDELAAAHAALEEPPCPTD